MGPRAARWIEAHLRACRDCLARVEGTRRLRALVNSAGVDPLEPDWSGFWPGIQARIAREKPRPVKDAWWLPVWRPFWGHPRLSLGGALAAGLLLSLSLWSSSPEAPAPMPVIVQDVSTPDPEKSVMVYSIPDQAVTVIWLFNADGSTDES